MVDAVVDWLMDSDPSIRWQVMRDLELASPAQVVAERARVARDGWGSQLLAGQSGDGGWGGADPRSWLESPDGSATYALSLLRLMGLDPDSEQARSALDRVRRGVTYIWQDGKPYFGGETEVCVNGMMLTVSAYFGETGPLLAGVVDRLLSEQLSDGGWNCDAPTSTRSSFNSTICVLEGLLEWERATGSSYTADARRRGEGYLLDRRMLRRRSTGEIADHTFTLLGFPPGWHYDVLRGLDYLREAGVSPDERVTEAVDVILRKRDSEGRWLLESAHPGLDSDVERQFWDALDIGPHEKVGAPSRWITLRALRVLTWADPDSRRG